jgi:hypothetical protein
VHYRALTLLAFIVVPTVGLAAFGAWYGRATAIVTRGSIEVGVVAGALAAGAIGLAIGSALCVLLSSGFRFSIRDVLWLTALVAMGAGWWVDRATDRRNFRAWVDNYTTDFLWKLQTKYDGKMENEMSRIVKENERLKAEIAAEKQ